MNVNLIEKQHSRSSPDERKGPETTPIPESNPDPRTPQPASDLSSPRGAKSRAPATAYRSRPPRRRWLPYAGGALLLGLLTAGLWPQPIPVETAPVTTGPLQAFISEEGKTRIRQRFTISAPVAGQLERIPYKAGEPVQAGQTVLARILPAAPAMLDARTRKLAEAKRDTSAAQLQRAEAALHFAASELRRIQELAREKTVSVQELETAEWRETSANKELEAARSALRQAEAELAEFFPAPTGHTDAANSVIEVVSPATGHVLRVLEESARVVGAGTPLVEIGNPQDLEAVIEVLSRDGAALTSGTKVELDQWGGPIPLQARVRLVEPSAFTKISALGVEEQRVNVVVDILTPPNQRGNLGDSFRVKARIIVWEKENALKVPSGALFRRGSEWHLFVIHNGRARLQPVVVGQSSGVETEILSGAQPGDVVIVYPGDRVKAGQRVRTITVASAASAM